VPTEATIDRLRDGCLAWVESVRDTTEGACGGYKYNRHMLRPCATESTAHLVFVLWILDALADYPLRDALVTFLLDRQDPESGWFTDPLITPEDHVGGHHTWQHIWDHHTGAVAEALEKCGVAPRYPLPKACHADLDTVDPREWTLSLDWTQPYFVGEHWMNAVMAHHRKHGIVPGSETTPVVDAAFDALERSVMNPETGLPDLRNEQGPTAGLGGLFKLLWAYAPCRRSVPYPDAAIRSVLGFQRPSGEFSDPGNMCMNWDAIFVLRHLTRDLADPAWRDPVRDAALALTDRLLADYRKPDGAFSFTAEACLTVHNSIRVSEPLPESDALGTPMCLECVAINEAWQAGRPSRSFADSYFGLVR